MRFTKMHGLGNDYVYVNCFCETVENPSEVAIQISDRHTGIGSDGLILIEPSDKADFFMSMYNSDGSRSEMCGNGIRCVGKYVYDYGLTDKTRISVDTLAGIKYLDLTVEDGKVSMVRVNMGAPILDSKEIPVHSPLDRFINEKVNIDDEIYLVTAVSMGNPHAIMFVDNVKTCPLETVGPRMEVHPLFPRRANIEFVQVHSRNEISMRVWERGSGETMACGTGTCATLVACVLNNLTDDKAVVHLLGGDLFIEWNRDENIVYMTGPATTVFDGNINL